MAAVSDVPDQTGNKIAIGARHRLLLERLFHRDKSIAKPRNTACFSAFHPQINLLSRSAEAVVHVRRMGVRTGVRFFLAFAKQDIFRASGWRRVPLNLVKQLLL